MLVCAFAVMLIAASACRESPDERKAEPYPRWHTPAGTVLPEHVLLDHLLESNAGMGEILDVARRRSGVDRDAARIVSRLVPERERELRTMRALLADRLRDVHARRPATADSIAAAALQAVPAARFATELRRALVDHHSREIALIDSSPVGYLEVQELVRGVRMARTEELVWLEHWK